MKKSHRANTDVMAWIADHIKYLSFVYLACLSAILFAFAALDKISELALLAIVPAIMFIKLAVTEQRTNSKRS